MGAAGLAAGVGTAAPRVLSRLALALALVLRWQLRQHSLLFLRTSVPPASVDAAVATVGSGQ